VEGGVQGRKGGLKVEGEEGVWQSPEVYVQVCVAVVCAVGSAWGRCGQWTFMPARRSGHLHVAARCWRQDGQVADQGGRQKASPSHMEAAFEWAKKVCYRRWCGVKEVCLSSAT